MSEQNHLSESKQPKRDLWLGRFWVYAIVQRWSDRGYIWKDQRLDLFQYMSDEESGALLESLGFASDMDRGEYLYLVSQVLDTFTEEQADELIAYLENHRSAGTKAWKESATKPHIGAIGITAVPIGGHDDIYTLCDEPNYDLRFKAEAYFERYGVEIIEPDPDCPIIDPSDVIKIPVDHFDLQGCDYESEVPF